MASGRPYTSQPQHGMAGQAPVEIQTELPSLEHMLLASSLAIRDDLPVVGVIWCYGVPHMGGPQSLQGWPSELVMRNPVKVVMPYAASTVETLKPTHARTPLH